MATAYSYVRFSSPEQARGDSLRRQIAASQQYVSGKLGTFISAIDSGKIERGSYLLVESIDRLSRDQILKSLNLFTSILSKGIVIVTLSDKKVYTEESINNLPDLIYSLMIMARAHEESVTKRSRVASAWVSKRQQARDDNIKLTHKTPSWLVLNNNHFTIVLDRAELIERIFKMCIDGHGGISIAKQTNHERIPTWRGGNGWHPTHIRRLLRTTSVYGDFVPGKTVNKKRTLPEPIHDYYPAIISTDTFFAPQRAIAQRTGKGGKPGNSVNLFSALLRCFLSFD